MVWYVRRTTGELEVWPARYGDLFGAGAIPDEDIEVDGTPRHYREFIRKDIAQAGVAPTLDDLKEAKSRLKTIVVYPQLLMSAQYEKSPQPYGGVFVGRSAPTWGVPVNDRMFPEFLARLEREEYMKLLLVQRMDEPDPYDLRVGRLQGFGPGW